MQTMAIALDIDGTLYDGVEVAPEAVAALKAAKAAGHRLLIVSGRRWEQIPAIVPIIDLFERVVGEEGGVLVNVATGEMTLLGEPIEPELVRGLQAAGVPFLDVGHVVVGTPAAWIDTVTEVRDRLGSTLAMVRNKSSVALAPPECNKGTGLRAALQDLGIEGIPVLAVGDAENDLAMFRVATIAVGVANADAAVMASGIPITEGRAGRGVAEALRTYLPRADDAPATDNAAGALPASALAEGDLPVGHVSAPDLATAELSASDQATADLPAPDLGTVDLAVADLSASGAVG